jgi:SAM-dependent methyltransferase
VRSFHNALLARNDIAPIPHHHLCGWNSAQGQIARFGALLRAVDYRGGSVVDYGCGTGGLFDFLTFQGYEFRYTGFDMNEGMIAVARSTRSADFRVIDIDSDEFAEADYVFASGIFQFSEVIEPNYYQRLMRTLLNKCKIALAANFLSSLRSEPEKRPDELYLHPCDAVQLASSLSSRWTIDHSYHPGRWDMTVGVYVARAKQERSHP